MQSDAENDPIKRAHIMGEWDLHKRRAERAYQQMKEDVALSKSDSTIELLTFDLEQSLPTPVLTTNVVVYKRQLWTYNLGIHEGKTDKGCMHMWHEGIASRGSHEVGSCLLRHIKEMRTTATCLILYSDSCGGQNRNVFILFLLLHIVANPEFPFEIINQKFMVPGHSFLPNDRDFGNIESARRKSQHLFVPEHWYDLVRTARHKNPFTVTPMECCDFVSLKSLAKAFVNRKINTQKQKVDWLQIRWIQVRNDKPLQYRYRFSHNTLEAWKTVDLKRKQKGRPVNIGQVQLEPLYDGARTVNKKKLDDLKSLLPFIPPVHHDFYDELVGGGDSDTENEEEQSEIHKPGVPLRPIVSCIGSPSYQLSKYITSLISPLAGGTDSHVKNSKHFVEMMGGMSIGEDEMLVSFDVSSLFTNVPVDEAVRVIRDRLQEDRTLGDRTTLSPGKVAGLLETCLKSTYFSYEQQEGAAMGSPVSAAVANLYMEFFEELALQSAPARPRLWKRYVDDTFCIVRKGTVDELLNHLNSVRPSIKFTVELEKDGTLPFLDTLLRRKEGGGLDVTVYRKPTHTDRYLNFQSHHPSHVKRGLVRCLYDRARSVTNSEDNLQKEDHIARVLKQNGYPGAFIRSSALPPPQDAEESLETEPQEEDRPPLVMLPYVAGVSEDIRRVCRKFDMRVVFKSGRTLRTMLTKVKDTLPTEKHSRVVYRVPCSCGQVYIGETVRRLETRMKEHQDACRRGMVERSAIAEHAWENQHPIKWEETEIVDQARRPKELLLKEALHI